MPTEIEIKLRIANPKQFLRNLKQLGAKPSTPRVHELNLLFDTPDGGLAKHGQLLRIRTESPAEQAVSRKTARVSSKGKKKPGERYLLTFKSPPEALAIGPAVVAGNRHKVREELETVLTDAGALQRIFEGLGLRGWFRYEKYRTAYRLPGRYKWAKDLLIDFDETPIGTYVELEGPHQAIDQAAELLGYHARDFITKNYLVLYLEECKRRGVPPTHMLFGNGK